MPNYHEDEDGAFCMVRSGSEAITISIPHIHYFARDLW